jgi:ribosome modulation factor
MKIIFILLITMSASAFAQSTFCDGWEDGYAAGKKEQHDRTYITPICPIPKIGKDTYENGYSMGYDKATGKSSVTIPNQTGTEKDAFCNGWDKGFESAMRQNGRTLYTIPVCPIPGMNEKTYDDGFARGYQKGLDQLGMKENPNTIVPSGTTKIFCDGWERGYQYGLEEWAIENNKTKPIKITPVCPIPKINEDTYPRGFELGIERAKKDMQ